MVGIKLVFGSVCVLWCFVFFFFMISKILLMRSLPGLVLESVYKISCKQICLPVF